MWRSLARRVADGPVDWNGRIGRGGWMALEAPIMKPWWLHWYSKSKECGERRQLLFHITASCTSPDQFACQSTKRPEIGRSYLIPHDMNGIRFHSRANFSVRRGRKHRNQPSGSSIAQFLVISRPRLRARGPTPRRRCGDSRQSCLTGSRHGCVRCSACTSTSSSWNRRAMTASRE